MAKKARKIYKVIVKCDMCGKVLQQSKSLTWGELMEHYVDYVWSAPYIKCKDCDTPMPNFRITLSIYNNDLMKEFKPEELGIKGNADNVDKVLDKFQEDMGKYMAAVSEYNKERKEDGDEGRE